MIDSRAQVFIISLNELNQLLTNHLRAALVLVPGPTIDHKRNCSNALSAEGVVGAPGEETCEHLVEQLVYQAVPVAVALVRHAADDLAPGLQAVEVLPHVVAFVDVEGLEEVGRGQKLDYLLSVSPGQPHPPSGEDLGQELTCELDVDAV